MRHETVWDQVDESLQGVTEEQQGKAGYKCFLNARDVVSKPPAQTTLVMILSRMSTTRPWLDGRRATSMHGIVEVEEAGEDYPAANCLVK